VENGLGTVGWNLVAILIMIQILAERFLKDSLPFCIMRYPEQASNILLVFIRFSCMFVNLLLCGLVYMLALNGKDHLKPLVSDAVALFQCVHI